jgi:hypothetical protein
LAGGGLGLACGCGSDWSFGFVIDLATCFGGQRLDGIVGLFGAFAGRSAG